MDYSNLIAKALQSGTRASGYDMEASRDYLGTFTPDRRYKLFAVCETACWAYNEHGKVRYAGREYEYQQTKDGYNVKLATW